MKSVMTASQRFAQAPKANIQRSTFDRSHGLKTTMDFDQLIPHFLDEVYPGDTFNLRTQTFGRLATPINPIMDNARLNEFYFFVPTRLVWDNFKKFMGEQDNPGDSIDYTIPQINVNTTRGNAVGELLDHFGFPTGNIGTALDVNVLPLRCYWTIWRDWFRDQNLQNDPDVYKGDATAAPIQNSTDYNWYDPAKRGKRHDYFTSCLPWTQKGDAVAIPLGDKALLTHDQALSAAGNFGVYASVPGTYQQLAASTTNLSQTNNASTEAATLYADLSNATGSTINAWRQAFQIQKFLERDARGGTRYIEKVHSHFGVTSPDYRLQRPEYLGGGQSNINVHPVPQQSSTDATTPQGNLSGFGTVSGQGGGFTKSFTEHGYIIGLVCATADITYQQGLDKIWSRSTQYDYYFPTFAHLGEQAVLNKEIYADGSANDDAVFGYQERWAELRYKPSRITGLFRSTAAASLDPWHLSEEFTTLPTLSSTFIESNTPVDRAIAVPAEPHLILDCYFNLRCTRPMPVSSPPGLIDHF